MSKEPRSFRLSEDAIKILKALSDEHGLSQAGYLEMILRKLAREEGIISGRKAAANS